MENIIKQVIESEYRAQKIIEEVENERSQAAYNIEKEILRLREEIFSSVKDQADNVRKEKMKQAQDAASGILSLSREKARLMLQKFEQNRAAWSEFLFAKILERR